MVYEHSQIMLLVEKLREDDKRKHFFVCFFLQLVFLFLLPVVISAFITLLIGFFKECWDKYCGTGFCWYDMAANVLGVGAGTIVFIVLQMLFRLVI